MATFGQREDLYDVTVIITGNDGKKLKFTVDKMSGGKVTGKVTKYRPANGTVDEQLLGGARTVSDISATALMTYELYTWVTWLMSMCGKADANVNKQPLDLDGNPYGKPLAYKGKLADVEPPPTNSESDEAGVLGLTVVAVTPITTG